MFNCSKCHAFSCNDDRTNSSSNNNNNFISFSSNSGGDRIFGSSNTRRNSSNNGDDAIIDSFNAKLNDLSPEERTEALHDIHGVKDRVQETPELLQEKFEEMNQFIWEISSTQQHQKQYQQQQNNNNNKNETGFQIAMRESPNYIQEQRLLFLRADNYRSKQAVNRLIRHFDWKYELFGQECLLRDLSFNDLSPMEQDALHQGLVQVLPHRDSSGRAIIFIDGKVNSMIDDSYSATRVKFYFITAIMKQDEECQLNGAVGIYYGVDQTKAFMDRPRMLIKTVETIPWRLSAVHFCKQNTVLEFSLRFAYQFMERSILCRFRIHIGTQIEVIYNLMTYGISKDDLPLNDDGTINVDHHHKVLQIIQRTEQRKQLRLQQQQQQQQLQQQQQQQQSKEESMQIDESNLSTSSQVPLVVVGEGKTSSKMKNDNSMKDDAAVADNNNNNNDDDNSRQPVLSSASASASASKQQQQQQLVESKPIILIPGPMDVIMGQGRHLKNCLGAIRLHYLLDAHQHDYEAASKYEKIKVAKLVLNEMKASKCRFITPVVSFSGEGQPRTTTTSTTTTITTTNINANNDDDSNNDDDDKAVVTKQNGDGDKKEREKGKQQQQQQQKQQVPVGGYVECDDSVALGRISHGFRNLRVRGSCISRQAQREEARKEKMKQQRQQQQQINRKKQKNANVDNYNDSQSDNFYTNNNNNSTTTSKRRRQLQNSVSKTR